MKPAIQVECLSKRYRLGTGRIGGQRTLREAVRDAFTASLTLFRNPSFPDRSPWDTGPQAADPAPAAAFTIWALQDVTFEVEHGEIVGVIGPNGSGKSTLLKILTRIVKPTEGRATIRGRVGSLLEVGTGFHPDLTGRENIFLSGSTLGMKHREILRKFDEIVAFAETEKFLDTPVKRYSSGMSLRLAFAVSAHLETDILIVDEALAVGDERFQRKCQRKMYDLTREGRTVLFVSHGMSEIKRLCRRALLLVNGTIRGDGPAAEVIDKYLKCFGGAATAQAALAGESSPGPGPP